MPLRSLTALLLLAVTAAGCADAPVSTSTAGLVTLKLSVCASAPLTATFMSSIQATTEASSTFGGTIYGAAKEAELSCIAEAANCFAVFTCLGYDTEQGCDIDNYGTSCIGETARNCAAINSAGYGWVNEKACDTGLEAVMGNDSCMLSANSWSGASCYAGTCDDGDTWCSGDTLHTCEGGGIFRDDGLLTLTDCSLKGQSCRTTLSGAACVTTEGEACSHTRCNGTVMETCGAYGVVESRFDCTDLGVGYQCTESGGVPACRRIDVMACDGTEIICVGDAAHICASGGWQVIDCGGFMGATCEADGNSSRCKSASWESIRGSVSPSNPSGTSASPSTGSTNTSTSSKAACEGFADAYEQCTGSEWPGCEDTVDLDGITEYYGCLEDYYRAVDCSEWPEFPEHCTEL